jgi:hypothetical protein
MIGGRFIMFTKKIKLHQFFFMLLLAMAWNGTASTTNLLPPVAITSSYGYYSTPTLNLTLNYPTTDNHYAQSPSFCYAATPSFNGIILTSQVADIRNDILRIGQSNVENIINQIIEREVEHSKDFVVLYHAQQREYVLLHDLIRALYQIIKKTPLTDFDFLRVPTEDFDTHDSVEAFLIKNPPYQNYDHQENINKYLLSVNATLFGNSYWSYDKYISECTFKYFLRSANGGVTKDYSLFIADLFNFIKKRKFFTKYKTKIIEMIKLLNQKESGKTGCLFQIFVPHTMVDTITYRAVPSGIPYYRLPGIDFSQMPYYSAYPTTETPVNTSTLLQTYSARLVDYLATTSPAFSNTHIQTEFDEIQFRILLDNKHMLNPNSGIKIYRYINQTPNFDAYQKELTNLVDELQTLLK